MEAIHSVFTANGQPILYQNETIILSVDNVSIYDGDVVTQYQKGMCMISSVRILWTASPGGSASALCLLHDSIVSVESLTAGFLGMGASPKLSILCRNGKHLKLSFSSSNKRDEFGRLYKQLLFDRQEYMRQQQAQQVAQQQQQQQAQHQGGSNNKATSANFNTSNAGIHGLIKQMEKKQEETDKALVEAFSDLKALMEKAKDMVMLSEKLKTSLDKQAQSSGSGEEEEFRSFLVQIGIAAPVTKKTAKSHYHTELSKQLAQWLVDNQILSKQGGSRIGNVNSGMIPLADLYCIFNRARGIELISPDDLYRACLLFEQLDLDVRLRRFDSGVMVVQSKNESDEQIAKEILEIIKESGGAITAFHLSKVQQISLSLANEKLLACEKLERLCRDETLEGVSFQENIFV